jgi:hypothetical protein
VDFFQNVVSAVSKPRGALLLTDFDILSEPNIFIGQCVMSRDIIQSLSHIDLNHQMMVQQKG